jgi:hypothetical protein
MARGQAYSAAASVVHAGTFWGRDPEEDPVITFGQRHFQKSKDKWLGPATKNTTHLEARFGN